MYIPEYMKNIQADVTAARDTLEKALETIENSTEYNERLHPFHAAAVANYNTITSIVLTLDQMEA